MFIWKKNNVTSLEIELSNSKNVKLQLDENNEWIGDVVINSQNEKIELIIEVENIMSPSSIQKKTLDVFLNKINERKETIFSYLECSFKNSKWEKGVEELEKMYFLSGIIIKKEIEVLWIIMEPVFDIPSIFNFFLRFTFKDSEIIWSNIASNQFQ